MGKMREPRKKVSRAIGMPAKLSKTAFRGIDIMIYYQAVFLCFPDPALIGSEEF